MSRQNTELKARLMAKAESVIDELLARKKSPAEATLTDIEQAVLVAGQRLERVLTDELLAASAAELAAPWPTCPECGQRMQAKGKRRRRVVTETGEVTLEREYYHCAACGAGLFPPG